MALFAGRGDYYCGSLHLLIAIRSGPAHRTVEHAQDFNRLPDTVDHTIRRAGHNELSCPFHSPRTANAWMLGERHCRGPNSLDNVPGRCWILICNVVEYRI